MRADGPLAQSPWFPNMQKWQVQLSIFRRQIGFEQEPFYLNLPYWTLTLLYAMDGAIL